MARKDSIARSIVLAVRHDAPKSGRSSLSCILGFFSTLFAIYQVPLKKICPADFANLRLRRWDVSDEEYLASFSSPADVKQPSDALKSVGDMGFSGSTFYATDDQKYLVKSVHRHSEHSFFRDDLLVPYVQHMEALPESMLVRIFDFLAVSGISVGRLLKTAPSHHIVMENILQGKPQGKGQGEAAWETWDLKPTSYFYPERDVADGRLTSNATKKRLADEFHDQIILTRQQADQLFSSLDEDTKLLAEHNAVDYSLFLVRIKLPDRHAGYDANTAGTGVASGFPHDHLQPSSWRTGIPSPDGKHVFRVVILDFFWAKHKAQPRLMTLLIDFWNLISKKGPMSITTAPDEYRQRFLKMCRDTVEVKD